MSIISPYQAALIASFDLEPPPGTTVQAGSTTAEAAGDEITFDQFISIAPALTQQLIIESTPESHGGIIGDVTQQFMDPAATHTLIPEPFLPGSPEADAFGATVPPTFIAPITSVPIAPVLPLDIDEQHQISLIGSNFQPITAGGGMATLGFGVARAAIPRLALAYRAAATLLNRAGGARLGPVTGRGTFAAIMTALGISQIFDIFDNPDASDQLQELVAELIDSGYIAWDPSVFRSNTGEPVTMEYIVLPVGRKADRETAYGMPYRPFSKSSIAKGKRRDNTYLRPKRAPRRSPRSR